MTREILKTSFVIAILAIFGFGNVSAQGVGDVAPDFTLVSSDGSNFTLSENQGKVVFINFVGYSCGICIGNASTINSTIYDRYKDNENFVAVAIDVWDGNEDEVNYYIDESGVSFPVLAMGSEVATSYNSGKHRVIVIDSEGLVQHNTNKDANAGEVADAANVINGLLGVVASKKDVQNEALKLFPNPAKTYVNVESDWLKHGVDLRIINSIGQTVLTKNLLSESKVDLANVKKGIYFVQLTSNNRVATKKLLIE